MPPRRQLQRLWLGMRFFLFALAALFSEIWYAPYITHLVLGSKETLGWGVTAALAILAALTFTPANRGRVHRWLGSLGKLGSKEQEAAAIAALISGGVGGVAACVG